MPILEINPNISRWSRLYSNDKSIGIAAAVASELARLVTLEMSVNVSGSPRADYITELLKPTLQKTRQYTEYACALGSLVFKPYVSGGKLSIDVIQADCFTPTAFDGAGNITAATFAEQRVVSKRTYTRLEKHSWTPEAYTIENRAYESGTNLTLGAEIPLSAIPEWTELAPIVTLLNVKRPLFSYFRIPLGNNKDRNSPLGVSVFSRAAETIKDAEAQYKRLLWEFEGGELAIDAEEGFLRPRSDDGTKVDLPNGKQRLFRRIAAASNDFYKIFSPELRDASLLNGFNAILRLVEWQCGLAYGTISDPQSVDKTAEEIRASKQRSYSTVRDIQQSLQNALDGLIAAIDTLTTLYKLAPQGTVDTAYSWDDSIINDPAEWLREMRLDASMRLIRPELYIAEKYGVSQEEAKRMIPEEADVL
ncbi:putative minor capsid protein, phage associated [Clostridia bacterium]|nr:putative minor capsid protein, phage associated [Clostridia bacterium]